MDRPDLLCLIRDTLGVAPGDPSLRPMSSAPAPPWTRPLARFMWDRMWSWAHALSERSRPMDLTFVPVWTALAEEVWDGQWERQILAVEDAETFRILVDPTRPLDGVVEVALEVTEEAVVTVLDPMSNRLPDPHLRVGRRMGVYAAVLRTSTASLRAEPAEPAGAIADSPTQTLDPWTQVMVPRAALDSLPARRRAQVERVLASLTDDGAISGLPGDPS